MTMTATAEATETFRVGGTYSATSVCNHNRVWTFEVISRTAKFITIRESDGETFRVGVRSHDGEEWASPFGTYSMSPVIRAGRVSKTVWKFPLTVTDVQEVLMPTGAQFLHVDVQVPNAYEREFTLWALVDPQAPKVARRIVVVGTGNPAPDDADGAEFVGTVMDDPFVWHVFVKAEGCQ